MLGRFDREVKERFRIFFIVWKKILRHQGIALDIIIKMNMNLPLWICPYSPYVRTRYYACPDALLRCPSRLGSGRAYDITVKYTVRFSCYKILWQWNHTTSHHITQQCNTQKKRFLHGSTCWSQLNLIRSSHITLLQERHILKWQNKININEQRYWNFSAPEQHELGTQDRIFP